MSFGQTIFKNIRYTLANESIVKGLDGKLQIVESTDPAIVGLDEATTVDQVVDLLSNWFRKFIQNQEDSKIVLPLSGGLDSRMLASFLKNSGNVSAFTYGISFFQEKSYEVALAKECARNLGIDWNFIQLGNFHQFLDVNSSTYGPSMHAHSMYHFEFYSIIKRLLNEKNPPTVLSGIYGDLWAGSWKFNQKINRPEDLTSLSLNHGVVFTGNKRINFTTQSEIEFFEKKKNLLLNPQYRIIEAARMKSPLIRHLIYTPVKVGFKVDSPFLDVNISMAMLRLPQNLRENRIWQKSLVKSLQTKRRLIPLNRGNNLDLFGTYKVPLSEIVVNESWARSPLIEMLEGSDFTPPRVTRLGVILLLLSESRVCSKLFPKISQFKKKLLTKYANYTILYPISRFKD
jgi:hypothetical protein